MKKRGNAVNDIDGRRPFNRSYYAEEKEHTMRSKKCCCAQKKINTEVLFQQKRQKNINNKRLQSFDL